MAKHIPPPSHQNCNETGIVVGWDEYKFDQFQTTDKYDRTITFYLLESPAEPRGGASKLSLFVYLNGSGGGSVFAPQGARFVGSNLYENFLRPSAGRARLLLVEKPGVQLHEEPAEWGTAEGCSVEFLRENTLERWTEAVNAAIIAAQTLDGIDSTRILVAGHSEGGYVATKVGAFNPKVTHVASIAAGGPTQLFDLVYFAEKRPESINLDTGKVDSSNDAIEKMYAKWKEFQDDPTSIDKFFGKHPFNRWSSYCASSPLEALLNSQAKAYLVHGTLDTATPVISFDIMRAELTMKRRDIVCERIEGADHAIKIAENGETRNELPNVPARIVEWFFESHSHLHDV